MHQSDAIPLNDPHRAVESFREDIQRAIARVLSSGWYVLGPENELLEQELSSYMGVDCTVLVGNGTDALEISLRALGIGQGDTVATVANAGGYATTAIRQVGATPLYVDIDAESLEMDPGSLRQALASHQSTVAAVVVTHLYGHAASMDQIVDIVREAGVAVVEDCAQALGARVNGRLVGTFGDISTTSFYPTKNLGALGDGGAIFTSSNLLADKVRRLRQYGWQTRYNSLEPSGRNSRLDEIQAAVLRERLPQLDQLNSSRLSIFSQYRSVSSPWGEFAHTVSERFVGHLAVFLTDRRKEFVKHLENKGIRTDIHYPIPDYRQPGFMSKEINLPITESRVRSIVSIPLFPELSGPEVERICDAIRSEK